jgi:hypothetical protein
LASAASPASTSSSDSVWSRCSAISGDTTTVASASIDAAIW